MSRQTRWGWAYVPAAVFWAVIAWIRYGLPGLLIVVGGGIALSALVMWRAGRFRSHTTL